MSATTGTLFAASSLALMVIALGPGCDSSESGKSGEAISALANPASVYCTNQGYRWETRMGPGGEYGVCVFSDESSCEEWAFYQGQCGQAFSYCDRHGGQIRQRTETQGSASFAYAVCVFSDGSECGESDYFEGSCQPGQCRQWSIAHGCVP